MYGTMLCGFGGGALALGLLSIFDAPRGSKERLMAYTIFGLGIIMAIAGFHIHD